MTPEFASLVDPTFHDVLNLVTRVQSGETVDLPAERNRIRKGLEEAETLAEDTRYPVRIEDFRLAKQGLVYWIDEVLTVAVHNWQSITLEWEYFGTRDRAWKFYVDGEMKARKSCADVAEAWYLCLVLGFEGDIINAFQEHLKDDRYENRPPEDCRKSWATELAQQIRQYRIASLPTSPFQGDVRPLTGTIALAAACQWAAALGVAFLVLLFIYWQIV